MKHWVFDLDCTLVDSGGNYNRQIEKIFAHFGRPCTEQDLRNAHNYFGPENFFGMYFAPKEAEKAVEMLIAMDLAEIHRIEFVPGMDRVLEKLSKHVELSVWTGRDRASAEKILGSTGLKRFFARLVSRSCVERTKPHPDGLLKILEAAKHKGDDVVMIGDHEYDLKGARAAAVKAVTVSWWGPNPHPLEKLSDRHFYRVDDLSAWIDELY